MCTTCWSPTVRFTLFCRRELPATSWDVWSRVVRSRTSPAQNESQQPLSTHRNMIVADGIARGVCSPCCVSAKYARPAMVFVVHVLCSAAAHARAHFQKASLSSCVVNRRAHVPIHAWIMQRRQQTWCMLLSVLPVGTCNNSRVHSCALR